MVRVRVMVRVRGGFMVTVRVKVIVKIRVRHVAPLCIQGRNERT